MLTLLFSQLRFFDIPMLRNEFFHQNGKVQFKKIYFNADLLGELRDLYSGIDDTLFSKTYSREYWFS